MRGFDVSEPYAKDDAYRAVCQRLSAQSGLIKPIDVFRLQKTLIEASVGKRFILQAGDCAERFSDATRTITRAKQKQLCVLGRQIKRITQMPVTVLGRWAGQYAKPRSMTYDPLGHLAYHGDLIHDVDAVGPPDVQRMLQGYACAQGVLKELKWPGQSMFSSHECLVLPYERAMRRMSFECGPVNVGAHLLWLGLRSWDNTALLEYMASIANPIGLKVGPDVSADALYHMVMRLNPQHTPGRIVLITRVGDQKVERCLSVWIQRLRALPFKVTWLCDPMHGNTYRDISGLKYRLYEEILSEIQSTYAVHAQYDSVCAGLHLEVTPDSGVQECVETAPQKTRQYTSAMDPRLNALQALSCVEAAGAFCNLSKGMVARGRIELPTRGFSVHCSTD
jgi:3-deoxy-7-phosphoheptulonate synthase